MTTTKNTNERILANKARREAIEAKAEAAKPKSTPEQDRQFTATITHLTSNIKAYCDSMEPVWKAAYEQEKKEDEKKAEAYRSTREERIEKGEIKVVKAASLSDILGR